MNELLEALARGPLVCTDLGYECAFCHERTGEENRESEEDSMKNLRHDMACPVNQARLYLSAFADHLVREG